MRRSSFIRCGLILTSALCLIAPASWAASEPRLALLIGNSSYKSAPLVNPGNDVRLMAEALTEAGFTVMRAENASIREMRRLLRDFGDRLRANGGVGLFYFAGHGVQVRGENYMISTDSDIRNEDEVADDAVNVNVILEKMQSAGNRMNLIILDACRNNPFAVRTRNSASGLAVLNAPSGSLVAYATAPGSVASDGAGRNGLYTEHLVRAIRQPGLPVEEVFKQVRTAVRRDSNNQQTPWENTALEGQFFFNPAQQAVAAPSAQASPALAAARPLLSAGTRVGTLVLTDTVTKSRRDLEVIVQQAHADRTVFSSGDVLAADGRLMQVRVGDAVLLTTSGSLWTIPLRPGMTGEAQIQRVDVDYPAPGSISWASVLAKDGKVRIDAKISYRYVAPSGAYFVNVSGAWSAIYDGAHPLPESFVASIAAANPSVPGNLNMISAEMKLR